MKKKRVAELDKLFQFMVSDLQSFKSDSEPQNFAAARLLERMRKRATLGKTAELKAKALTKFVKTNEYVSQRTLALTPDEIQRASSFIRNALNRFTVRTYGEDFADETFCYEWVWDNWRFGPGASNGIRGTHTAEKIQQKLTSTLACQPFVSKLRHTHPGWTAIDCGTNLGVSLVEGSRITVVPKNEDTVRTIAIGPSGNMAIQLALGRYLEGALRLMGLDIQKQQPINKKFARFGSLTGEIATLDLSSASDLIGRDLVRMLFPPEWVLLLELTRSQKIEVDGQWHTLNMISEMGNGYTFPLMTMIIVSLIYATRTASKRNYISWYKTAVFGDDIIVPTEEVDLTISILERAGFIVNHDKSYSFGPFRESCGGDYYEGVDVTPFYVKSLNTTAEVYVTINQVLEWWAKTRIPLKLSYNYLVSSLQHKVFFVPEWLNPDQGILTAAAPRNYKYLARISEKRELSTNNPFAIALASAGYVDSGWSPDGLKLYYISRECKSRMIVRSGRIPSGFRSGWAAEKRTIEVSQFIELVTQ